MKEEIRRIRFGKYKGWPILRLIAKHPGYIMWCLENVDGFSLNKAEQTYYDWNAIAIVKYEVPLPFPIQKLCAYVNDKDALSRLDTPIVCKGVNKDFYLPTYNDMIPLLKEADCGRDRHEVPNLAESIMGMHHAFYRDLMNTDEDCIEAMETDGLLPHSMYPCIGD